ncbi:pleiotropic drug resistance ABC transporter [Amylostereum chailletii]|nr:pleiotropic drug resistance ABC transporter [Amylostereum chailletii]
MAVHRHIQYAPSPLPSTGSYDDIPESLRPAGPFWRPAHSRNASSISMAQSEYAVAEVPLLQLNTEDIPIDIEEVLHSAVSRRSPGIQTRQLGVIFKNLRVVGLGATAGHQNTFASLFDPRVWLAAVQQKIHPPLRDIISGFEGVIRPKEMLLVLGNPGSGCSTLLKTLTNQRKDYHTVKGEVFYDTFTPAEMEKRFRGDIIYCAEDDVHFPTLTVDQTLRFAAKTRAPHDRMEGMSRKEFIDGTTESIEQILGLVKAKDTVVGDASIRGVSGGEKKRVSIGEMLALRAVVGAWDNSTRGLDASTALEFVTALRTATNQAKLTTIVSIYQAGESLYKQFDKVCLLYEGRMAYFGPADVARQYFIDLGFDPAPRQTTADFLTAVTDPNARTIHTGFEHRAPRTAGEFADAFLNSSLGGSNKTDMKVYKADISTQSHAKHYEASVLAEHAKTQRDGSLYIISIPMQFRAVALRRFQIIRGDVSKLLLNISTYVLQAVITGTVFLKLKASTDEYFSRCSVLSTRTFSAVVYATMTSLAEIHALFGQRPIILKHFRSGMYHPFVEAAVYTVVDISILLITIFLFAVILYFLVGLQRTPEQFFVFAALMFIVTITVKILFRAIAAAVGGPLVAQTIAGLFLLASTLYSGFMIPSPYMVHALKWISIINPLRYGFEGMVTNEFRTIDGECASLVPQGPGYDGQISSANQVCAIVGSHPGLSTVNGLDYVQLTYEYSYSHLARNFILLGSFALVFFFFLLVFTEINTSTNFSSSTVLFKRGSRGRFPKNRAQSADEKDSYIGEVQEGHSLTGRDDSTIDRKVDMHGTFTWQNLQYSVPMGGGRTRRLLDDVSGYVAPGKLTALMGESGAGKTTLLNVLAQRQDSGVVIGRRLVDGQPLPADFRAQTGYCQQVDTHLAETTVREALLFSAFLRQPSSVSREEKETYVESVLSICGLTPHADAIVGTLGVEHRKRTTIAVELAARPKLLLFLDEPTSGLDSQSAWAIMSFLRTLADHGQAILCTIHQPSAELFQVFDRLLLLRKGGQTVYFGDIGPNARDVIGYFEKNGGHSCPPDENPAEYILDVIGAGATASSEIDWHEAWRRSSQARQVERDILLTLEGRHTTDHERGGGKPSAFATSWFFQTKLLLKRDITRHWRDSNYLLSKLVLNVVAAAFIGVSFYQAKNSIQGTLNKRFSVFVSMIVGAPLANQILVPFISTRKVYELRERPSRMYRWSALLTAQILGEIPWNIIGSCCYFSIWYWLIGFPTERAGYAALLMGLVYPLFYTTLAQAVAAVASTPEIAGVIFSFVFSILIMPNGVLQPVSKLGWWVWVYRVSPYTYLIEGAVGIAVANTRIDCASVEFVKMNPPQGSTCSQFLEGYMSFAGGTLTNPNATAACTYCPYDRTNDLLEASFDIVYSHHWRNLGLVCAYIVFNIFIIFAGTYVCRIHQGRPLSFLRLSSFKVSSVPLNFLLNRPKYSRKEMATSRRYSSILDGM